jgi:MtaA/CmuA family methyltransferase
MQIKKRRDIMTGKERVYQALTHKQADRVPFVILDGGTWVASLNNISLGQMLELEDCGASLVVDAFKEGGSDWASAMGGFGIAFLAALGAPVNMDKVGASAEVGIVLDNPEEQIPNLDKTKIRQQLLDNDLFQKVLKQTRGIKKLVGDEQYITYSFIGPFSAAGVMVGTENLMVLLMDEPELVEDLLDYTTELCAQVIDLFHEAGADIPVVAEPTGGGEVISLGMFEEWVVPTVQNLKKKVEGKYDFYLMHSCGNSGNRIPSLRDCGVDGFSVDFPVDLSTAMKDSENKLTVIGKVSPSGVLLSGTPEEVYADATACIQTAGSSNYILMPGCDLASGTPMENIKMMAKASLDSQK